MDLRSQLQTLSNDGLSVSAYILKAKKITGHLVVVGDPISDRDIMIFIVWGLGSNSNYTSFVTSVNMSDQKPSMSALRGLIKTYNHMFSKQSRLEHNKVFQAH